MCDLTDLEQRINFNSDTPSDRSTFSVSYEMGIIICITEGESRITFNREFPYNNTLADSVQFLQELGEEGICIGACQNEPQ